MNQIKLFPLVLMAAALIGCYAQSARNNPLDPEGTAFSSNAVTNIIEAPYVLGVTMPSINKPAQVQISWPVRSGATGIALYYTNENGTIPATAAASFTGSGTTQALVTVSPLARTNNFFVKYSFATSNVTITSNTMASWKTYGSAIVIGANQVDISIRGYKPYMALSSGTTVNVYDGSSGSWSLLGGSVPSTNTVASLSLASGGVNGDIPYVVYAPNASNAATRSFKYTGSWSEITAVLATSATNTLYYNPSDQFVYVMIRDAVANNLKIFKESAGSWVTFGGGGYAASLAHNATTLGLAYDSLSGNIYTTFMDNGETSVIHYYNGTTWINYNAGNSYGTGTTSPRTKMQRIAAEGNKIWVACLSKGAATRWVDLYTVSGGSWTAITPSSDFPLDNELDLRVSKGVPVVSFRANSGKTTVMKYANSTWSYIGAASEFGAVIGGYMRMNVDDDGVPYVVYDASGQVTVWRYEPF